MKDKFSQVLLNSKPKRHRSTGRNKTKLGEEFIWRQSRPQNLAIEAE